MTPLENCTDTDSVFQRKVRIIEALDFECEAITGQIVTLENELQPVLDTEAQLNLDLTQDPQNAIADEQLTLVEQKVKTLEEARDNLEVELGELEDAINSIKQTLSIEQLQLLKTT